MRYETSYKIMVTGEKGLWESLLKNSTKLLELLNGYKGSDECLAKYISLLFGLRCAHDSRKELLQLIDDIDNQVRISQDVARVDNYVFQRWLKYFLGDIDSVFDYMDKLSLLLMGYNVSNWDDIEKKIPKSNFYFNRKESKIANEVSGIRNGLLHEGLPIIEPDTYSVYNLSPCQAHAAGISDVYSTIYITFTVRKSDKVKKELRSLLNHIYYGTTKSISEFIEQLINTLEK